MPLRNVNEKPAATAGAEPGPAAPGTALDARFKGKRKSPGRCFTKTEFNSASQPCHQRANLRTVCSRHLLHFQPWVIAISGSYQKISSRRVSTFYSLSKDNFWKGCGAYSAFTQFTHKKATSPPKVRRDFRSTHIAWAGREGRGALQ